MLICNKQTKPAVSTVGNGTVFADMWVDTDKNNGDDGRDEDAKRAVRRVIMVSQFWLEERIDEAGKSKSKKCHGSIWLLYEKIIKLIKQLIWMMLPNCLMKQIDLENQSTEQINMFSDRMRAEFGKAPFNCAGQCMGGTDEQNVRGE